MENIVLQTRPGNIAVDCNKGAFTVLDLVLYVLQHCVTDEGGILTNII